MSNPKKNDQPQSILRITGQTGSRKRTLVMTYLTSVSSYHFLLGVKTNSNVTVFSTHFKSDVLSCSLVSDQEYTV